LAVVQLVKSEGGGRGREAYLAFYVGECLKILGWVNQMVSSGEKK
jgi:hypothetical protein